MIREDDFVRFITIKKGLSAGSVRLCKVRFSVFMRWVDQRIITKDLVEEFLFSLKQKGQTNNSINSYIFFLRYLSDYCKDREMPSTFLEGITSLPKNKTDIVILTPDEIRQLLDIKIEYANRNGVQTIDLDFTYTSFIMFLAYTGCRYSEASGLKVAQVDLSVNKVKFIETKNKEHRFAYLPLPLANRLTMLIGNKRDDELVFTNSMGTEIGQTTFSPDLKKRALLAGIKKRIHPHLFRHSFATQLLINGVDITMVASLLGHKDIQTTFANYVHLADESLRKSTWKHPLIRESVNPIDYINQVKEFIEGYDLLHDNRFEYVKVNKAVSEFLNTLYESVKPEYIH